MKLEMKLIEQYGRREKGAKELKSDSCVRQGDFCLSIENIENQFVKINEFDEETKIILKNNEINDERKGIKVFNTRTHLKKIGSGNYCVPVFVMSLEGDEKSDDFSIYYQVGDGESGNICPLKRKVNNVNTKIQYFVEETKEVAVGTTQPGCVDIIITDKAKKEKRKLFVQPSSLTIDQFNKMLSDLRNVPSHIFLLDEERKKKAKTAVGNDLISILEVINEYVTEVGRWLRKINMSPRGTLKHSKQLVPYNKIKKINGMVMEKYLKYGSNKKILVTGVEPAVDIYEHRIFYNRLKRLKDTVDVLTNEFIQDQKKRLNDREEVLANEFTQDQMRWQNQIEEIDNIDNNENDYKGKLEQEKTSTDGTSKNEKNVHKQNLESEKDRIGIKIEKAKELHNRIAGDLKKHLGSSIFKGFTRTNEEWRMTQILINDVRYYQIYKVLKPLDNIPKIYSFDDWKKVFVEKTDKIYELWILVQIIKLLQEQQWSLLPKDGGDINKIYDTFNPIQIRGEEEWTLPIHWKHDNAGLEMDMFYNTPITESLKDLIKEPQSDPDNAKRPDFLFRIRKRKKVVSLKNLIVGKQNDPDHTRRPDFLFRIRKMVRKRIRKEKEKVFTLDVKYRNYEGTYGKEGAITKWIKNDIIDVSYKKYIKDIETEVGEAADVIASFTVHTDSAPFKKEQLNSSSCEYSGKFVTYNATVDPVMVDPVIQKISEQIKKLDGAKQQIGSFFMLPPRDSKDRDSYENLKTFFVMIFEYYLGITDVCWNCGNNEIEHKENGNICKCGHFWKKTKCNHCGKPLIKHWYMIKNYHIIKNYENTKQKVDDNNKQYIDNGEITEYKRIKNAICVHCGMDYASD